VEPGTSEVHAHTEAKGEVELTSFLHFLLCRTVVQGYVRWMFFGSAGAIEGRRETPDQARYDSLGEYGREREREKKMGDGPRPKRSLTRSLNPAVFLFFHPFSS
jgi:hypothetical protein